MKEFLSIIKSAPIARKWLWLVSCVLLGSSLAYGQVESVVGESEQRQKLAAELQRSRVALTEAKTLFNQSRLDEAEAAVMSMSRAQPDSVEYQLEGAQAWIQLVGSLVRDAKLVQTEPHVQRALSRIEVALKMAKTNEQRASARLLAAHIEERYRGNIPEALAHYQAVVQLTPKGGSRAREAVERLTRMQEIASQRTR